MGMPHAPEFTTAKMVRALPGDGNRYETVHGELLASPADISWSEDTLVQPDLFVIHPDEVGAREWSAIKRLLLVVEVASRSTARADRYTKRRLYQEVGDPALLVGGCRRPPHRNLDSGRTRSEGGARGSGL